MQDMKYDIQGKDEDKQKNKGRLGGSHVYL